jgi:hypothetical protein
MASMNYPQQGQQQGGGQGVPQQLQNGMMRPMGTPGLNGFAPGAMQNIGNNPGMNMQIGGQPMGGNQMSPQAMATAAAAQQQVSVHFTELYLHHPHSWLVDGCTVPTRTSLSTDHAEYPQRRFAWWCVEQCDARQCWLSVVGRCPRARESICWGRWPK